VGFYLMIFADLVMQSHKTVRTDTGLLQKNDSALTPA